MGELESRLTTQASSIAKLETIQEENSTPTDATTHSLGAHTTTDVTHTGAAGAPLVTPSSTRIAAVAQKTVTKAATATTSHDNPIEALKAKNSTLMSQIRPLIEKKNGLQKKLTTARENQAQAKSSGTAGSANLFVGYTQEIVECERALQETNDQLQTLQQERTKNLKTIKDYESSSPVAQFLTKEIGKAITPPPTQDAG